MSDLARRRRPFRVGRRHAARLLGAGLLAALAVAAVRGPAERTARAAATADEKVVNVYSARHYDSDDALYARFTEQTGIEVNVIEGDSDALIARIDREGELSPADVLITVDAGRLEQAARRGIFQPIESSVLVERVPGSLRDPEGRWYGLTRRVRVIVTALDRVPEGEPATYEALAEPAWKGRVVTRSSGHVYNQSLVASIVEARGAEAAEAWCRGLVANFARRPQGNDRAQIRAVAAGEADAAIVNHYYVARMREGSEADRRVANAVRVVFPNQPGPGREDAAARGAHVNVSGAGVVRGAPNRAHAIRFLEFLASDEAQRAFAAGNHEYPVVDGVPVTDALEAMGDFEADPVPVSALGRGNRDAVRIMERAGWR